MFSLSGMKILKMNDYQRNCFRQTHKWKVRSKKQPTKQPTNQPTNQPTKLTALALFTPHSNGLIDE